MKGKLQLRGHEYTNYQWHAPRAPEKLQVRKHHP